MSSSSVAVADCECRLLHSSRSGRAEACARRCARLLRERGVRVCGSSSSSALDQGGHASFDAFGPERLLSIRSSSETTTLVLFVSTTGAGEHCDPIRRTWRALLRRSLPSDALAGVRVWLFALGDRAYGDDFCAAGRRTAARLTQLGAMCATIGYGDDGTPGGGVFADLEVWLSDTLLPGLLSGTTIPTTTTITTTTKTKRATEKDALYEVEWLDEDAVVADDDELYDDPFFRSTAPRDAYRYGDVSDAGEEDDGGVVPLRANVTSNERLTAADWFQDVRHVRLDVTTTKTRTTSTRHRGRPRPHDNYYRAGDVAVVLFENDPALVDRVLRSTGLEDVADRPLRVTPRRSRDDDDDDGHRDWPSGVATTLRALLARCCAIHDLPAREDLFALSLLCRDVDGEQARKLRELSTPDGNDLYVDYVLREKRDWADVLRDFDEVRLTAPLLLSVLPRIRPRAFSIASAPREVNASDRRTDDDDEPRFRVDLCVAVVRATTPFGRSYEGSCSGFLGRRPSTARLWIAPGSFGELPTELADDGASFRAPILCVGAGTGVAPLRALIREREALRPKTTIITEPDAALCLGVRRPDADLLYGDEWRALESRRVLRWFPAFSRGTPRAYVQHRLRELDASVARHVLERGGAVYVAGGTDMARAAREQLVRCLGARLAGGAEEAERLLRRMNKRGTFRVEAWS